MKTDLFYYEIKELLSNEYDEFLKAYSQPPFRGLRVNTLKCTAERLFAHLDFEPKKTPFCPDGYYIPQGCDGLGKHPLHHAGAFYIQEPSASSAVEMLGVKQGDRVLDLCASPGGKSTQIASKLGGEGLLVANEIVRSRANILLSNIERMGVKNAVVTSCHPQTIAERLCGFFDCVLVDAPCSGEGMFRKESEALSHWSYEHTVTCAVRQLEILNSAKHCLKENGVLVYSTCTYNKRENEGVILRFLEQNPDFVIEDSGADFGRITLQFAKRIFINDGGEGHFCCCLKKTSPPTGYTSGYRYIKPKEAESVLSFYDSIFIDRPFGENVEIIKDKLYLLPDGLPELGGLNVLRSGVLLGELKRSRIEPAHAAFAAAKPCKCRSVIDLKLTDSRTAKFLHGEEIPVPSDIKGYTAVAVEGVALGFGKAVGGVLKNKYPKGLRDL